MIKKARLYVDPDFKKMLKQAVIDNDEKNVIQFTRKVYEEPEILARYKNKKMDRGKKKNGFSSFF